MKPRLTYANVVATIALVCSLGGSAWALTVTGAQVKDGSLTGRDIKNGKIARADLGSNSVNSAKIGTGAITSSDVKDSSIMSGDLNAALLAQVQNAAHFQQETPGTLGSMTTTTVSVSCGSGSVLGGGAAFAISDDSLLTLRSWPDSATSWSVRIRNETAGAVDYTAYATCVT